MRRVHVVATVNSMLAVSPTYYTRTKTYSILGTNLGTIYFALLRGTPATLMRFLLVVPGALTERILEYYSTV